jgi:two-component system sensor histidine kinase KdpD
MENNENRPNPDEILNRIKIEEKSIKSLRGKLKIFFGAAAGVGKTYTMLESAKLLKKEGKDVVIGWIETHKRTETEMLLEGFEILPPKSILYKNIKLNEFDIDAALKRKPEIILVDELAHTNISGSRHSKRWQDIDELLDNGISVWTTLNVQHCESATDIVVQITGVKVYETVPDTIIENADEIELVDIPTEELLKRLKDGKVYIKEMADRAIHHFFQPGNLIALRQLALRYTQHNVEAKLISYKQVHSISKVWSTADKFMICIGPNPNAFNLIRAGKRIASGIGAEWAVVFVETVGQVNQKERELIAEAMRFAEKLGARTTTLAGIDIADTLISYASSKNITKIILGKPEKPKWQEYIFGSVVDRLAHKAKEIDIYLLSSEIQQKEFKPSILQITMSPFSGKNLLRAIGIIILCTIIDKTIFLQFAHVNLIMIYLLGITWIAFRYGKRISIIASFLSVIFFNFFFLPLNSINVNNIEYFITFAVMLVVGLTISYLTGQLRRQNTTMQFREDRTQALYELSRDLSKNPYLNEIFKVLIKHIESFFKCRSIIFIPDKNKNLVIALEKSNEINLSQNEIAVAKWVYENKKSAGKFTETLSGSKGLYLPLTGAEKIVGVIGVFSDNETQFVNPEQFHLLEMFINQTAMAAEAVQLASTAVEVETKIENERLRNLLLTTFSSEIKEPLDSIFQSISNILKSDAINEGSSCYILIGKVKDEVEHLKSLIEELPKIIA